MQRTSVLRIVVASPGDVHDEREALSEVVAELNANLAASQGLFLHLNRWETDAYPGFHAQGPQGLIDEFLRIEDCDLLIGIFWKRFGTPVSDAESGTAHEFRKAYRAWKARGQPQIMVYFNQKPYKPKNREETEQQRKVLDFEKNFPTEGLWWPYTGKANFEALVRGHLTRYVLRLAKDVAGRDDSDRAVDQELELLRMNPDRAAAKYREAIQVNPESAEAHNGLGVALHFKRDLEGAVAELRDAIRLNPEIAYQHNNLGCVLHDKGDFDGAIVEFREAFRLDPSHAKSHGNLGEILLKKGDRKGALEQYSIASKLRPDNALYRSVYEGLKAEVESVNEALVASSQHSKEIERLVVEIRSRLNRLPALVKPEFTYTELHTAKGAFYGEAEHHPRVGILGDFKPMFSEYQGKGLLKLLLDLRNLVPQAQFGGLDRSLRAAEEIPGFITRLKLVKPVGQEDSKWTMEADDKARYRVFLATAFDVEPLDWMLRKDGETAS